MDPGEFARLVDNIRTDGKLTSAPLACQLEDGSLELLSGHHRTAAAMKVGLAEIDVIVITTPLSEERKAALQLSHNAVEGKDNPTVLAEMYRSLGLDAKMFSGLTDEVLDLEKLTISGFNAGMDYEELKLAFLPQDLEAFRRTVKRITGSKKVETYVARFQDFDHIFDTIVDVKAKKNVQNNALALLVMAELAMERLQQLEPEADAEQQVA